MSPEESEGEGPKREKGHWTDTHPDRDLWSPGRLALARTQTQEEYEALYGGGAPVKPQDGKPRIRGAANAGEAGGSSREGLRRRQAGRVPPPSLFRDVAERIGIQPPNRPPRPPKIPLDDRVAPENRPPDFWDPEVDGGPFEETATWESRPPEQHGEEPQPNELADPPARVEPGPAHAFTADSIAFYHPWHVGGDAHWGIYFRTEHMNRHVERVERLFGWTGMRDLVVEQVLWHEMEHFEQEKAATALEDLLGHPVYADWLANRYSIPVRLADRKARKEVSVSMIEEALATAREVEWARDSKEEHPPSYASFVEWDSMSKPIGYRSFYLCLGDDAKQEARAAFLESVTSVAQLGPGYRLNGETAKRLFGNRARTFKSVPIAWVDH